MQYRFRLTERLSLRLERRWLQVRALWKRRELASVIDRTAGMPPGPILFSTQRNEVARLPWFLKHYRKLGVVHFLMVDNGSTDGSAELLCDAPDVSLWRTDASYRESRYGVDWLNALLARYGHGRWVLAADPDELLIYPRHDTRRLPALCRWIEANGRESMGAMLLDLYGDGPVSKTVVASGQDPVAAAPWFDAHNYSQDIDRRYRNLWIQGGPRQRVHFADNPREAPALNKVPLVRWQRGFVFRNSAHNLLPRRLNRTYARSGDALTSGVMLHTKFTLQLQDKIAEEMERGQHYNSSAEYRAYANSGCDVSLWNLQSTRFSGWRQLCALGQMSDGGWF